MNSKYLSIKDLPHHTSSKHPRMDMNERAAQFSPFAAVSGYGAAIDEAARLTCPRFELDEDEKAAINERLTHLEGTVTLTYYVKDPLKDGGKYVTESHTVKKTDPSGQYILFTDGLKVKFEDIYRFED